MDLVQPMRVMRALRQTALAACLLLSMTGAGAAQDKTTVLRVALVDIERISSEYNFNINAVQQLQKLQQQNAVILRLIAQHALLTEADTNALADLIQLENGPPANFTAEKKAQKQQLLEKSKKLSEEYLALQSKMAGQLNDQDKAKLKQFATTQNEAEQRFNKRQEQMQQALQDQAQQNRTKALKDVREAIAKVAKAKGIALVLSNEIAWYSENDLTDDVIKALNKK